MKKFLAKLALFTMLATMLATLNTAMIANADDGDSTDDDINIPEFEEDQCVSDDEMGEFIIVTAEESFGEPYIQKSEDGEKVYEQRKCYRNTWTIKYNNEEATLSENLKNCAGEDATGYEATTYSCQEIMVILSKGGTIMIKNYIGTIYRWAATIVGIIAVLVIVLSGIQLSISGGDSEAVQGAKDRIIKSLTGIAVLFLSGLILYTINPNFFVR